MVHSPRMCRLQWIDSFDTERVVRISLGNKRRAKANSSLRTVNTSRAIHTDRRFRRQHHYITTRTRLPKQSAPNLGQHRRGPRTRRILAAVQQRGSKKDRQHTSARLLNTLNELHRPHPRPHRRLPRIHIQDRSNNHQHFQLEPRVQPALIKQGGPTFFVKDTRIRLRNSLTLKSSF